MIDAEEYGIVENCDECGYITKISPLFSCQLSRYYYCKCDHPSNKNIFTKILWYLNGCKAKEKET